MIVKPYLLSLPTDWQLYWHLLPLYQAMDSNPSDFWPPHLLKDGIKWVKEQIKPVSLSEDEVGAGLQSGTIAPSASLFALCLEKRFRKSITSSSRLDNHRQQIGDQFEKRSDCVVRYFNNCYAHDPEACRSRLAHRLNSGVHSIALSANLKLLSVTQMAFTATEIVTMIKNPKIRNRIALMLHLLPKVDSYYGNVKVNKNSIFFRNWVMLHFPASEGQKIADLKLLYYYFQNRILGRYPGFDIFNREETGNQMVFGLLNDPDTQARGRWNKSWDLTFEPTNVGPVIEEVRESRKRSREDEGNSSNKRQKTLE